MGKSGNTVKSIFFVILIIPLLSGCTVHDLAFSESEGKTTPARLMQEGVDSLDKGSYGQAVRAFEKIIMRHPDTKFADTAMLKMADAYYGSEEYHAARIAYEMYEQIQSGSPDIPYVIYQEGMCYFNEVNGVDKNQGLTLCARGRFEQLVKLYPSSEYAERARKKIRECDQYLAEYELQVGHFYYDMKKYRAAIGRYRYVIKKYPDLAQHQVALEYLKRSNEILNRQENTEGTYSGPGRQETVIASRGQEEAIQPETPALVVSKTIIPDPAPRKAGTTGKQAAGKTIAAPSKRLAFSVQVGAFLVKRNAEKLLADLTRRRYHPFILEISDRGNRHWYSVRIINCRDSSEAFRVASEYKQKEGRPAIVTAIDSLDPVTPDL